MSRFFVALIKQYNCKYYVYDVDNSSTCPCREVEKQIRLHLPKIHTPYEIFVLITLQCINRVSKLIFINFISRYYDLMYLYTN